MTTDKKHHVACDLDGTLATYDHWRGIDHIGEPVEPVLRRVKALLEAGHQVSIFTSRVAGDWPEHIKDIEAARRHIECWCYRHVGRILPVTAHKHGWFTEIWDDKALGIRNGDVAGKTAAWQLADKPGKMRRADMPVGTRFRWVGLSGELTMELKVTSTRREVDDNGCIWAFGEYGGNREYELCPSK